MERQNSDANTNLNCWTLWIFCRFVRSLGLCLKLFLKGQTFCFSDKNSLEVKVKNLSKPHNRFLIFLIIQVKVILAVMK